MLDSTKRKIRNTVLLYIELHPDEYNNFKKGISEKRLTLKNKFAEVKGTDIELRLIHEMPEILYNFLRMKLSPDELEELQSTDGAIWFAKTFNQFKVAEKL